VFVQNIVVLIPACRIRENYQHAMADNAVLIGHPKSTFTRSIALGLYELGIPFKQIPCLPKSEEAFKIGVNPFGHIPSLLVGGLSIFETVAIARFLDEKHSTGLRRTENNVRVDQLVSVAADYVFRAVEYGCVKPRAALEESQVSEESIKISVAKGVEEVNFVLGEVEKLVDANGPFLVGAALSWADLFMYPALADLKSTPEGAVLQALPRLHKWMAEMDKRESVQSTFPDSIADLRSKAGKILN